VKGPEPYLKTQAIDVRDAIDGRRRATVDPARRVFIGHDLFYFADAASQARFEKDPLRWAKRLTDPVTLKRFAPTARSPRATHMGRRYWFASDSTFAAFQAMPDSFALRKGM
jgi:YHS domain-containing protein